MAVDLAFGGIATEEAEGERIAATIGNHSRSHDGQSRRDDRSARTVAEAYDAMYYPRTGRAQPWCLPIRRAQPLSIMSDELAERTAAEWDVYKDAEFSHFAEMKRILDREDPSYAD